MPDSSPSESTDNNPENRTYEKPVAWLAGRDLLGGIKGILLYTAYGSKLDPRDWMSGKVVPFDSGVEEEFWFDFLADAGDGTKAMYAIAYMTMTDLWANADGEPLSEDGKQQIAFKTGQGRELLPRGQFLIFGGDTAYHVADYLTIANRIQRPFTWAYLDLRRPDQDIDVRPVFGIPGNHDYYDQLDGFRRQFRKSSREEPPQPPKNPGGDDAQLGLAGYCREQEASYFALKLPFDWWLWGLDTETGAIDSRQAKFFLTRGEGGDNQPPPDKLIIVTPSPSTVFGKSADKENDFKATKAMIELLGKEQPFLPKVKEDGSFDFSQTGDHQLKRGQCRLDIAGDVHHYARYWGPPPNTPSRTRERAAPKPVPEARSYASIVTGLGGAFHHPSNTYDDEIQEQVLYPSEKDSREEVGKVLFDFRSIFHGGYVFLFGAIIAALIYFSMSVTQSSRQDISQIGVLERLNLVKQEPIRPTAVREKPCDEVPPLRLPLTQITLGPSFKTCDPSTTAGCPANGTPACSPAQPFFFFITARDVWPRELWVGMILIFLSLGGTIGTFVLQTWLFGPNRDPRKPRDKTLPKAKPGRKLLLIVPPIAIAVFIGMFTVGRYRAYITPFVSSLLVLFTMIVAAAGIVLTVRYNDYLFIKGHDDYIKNRHRIWPWVLPFLSVLVLGVGLSAFGRNNLPALLVSDMLFALVFVGVLLALIALPFKVASAELFYTLRPRLGARILKFLIGLWHAVLQLFVPFVLIRKGTFWTWIIAAIPLLIPIRLSERLFKKSRGISLAILWVLYGSFVLVLPWLTSKPSSISFFNTQSHFDGVDWLAAPWGLVPTVLAGVAGAVMSCLWFGWYLGVCSAFNGHNNEVGGAARIEKFKQFIRFKVTKDRLTGYVIAVDDVSLIGDQDEAGNYYDGRVLKPKLIEVFHLEVKK